MATEMATKSKELTYSETPRDQIEANLALKELAFRELGEMAVALYWHKKTNSLSIALKDAGVNVAFVVEGHEGLDAFYHPYPYAHNRGLIDYANEQSVDDGA